MTVQELIDILQGVKDKSKPVVMYWYDDNDIRECVPVAYVDEWSDDITICNC